MVTCSQYAIDVSWYLNLPSSRLFSCPCVASHTWIRLGPMVSGKSAGRAPPSHLFSCWLSLWISRKEWAFWRTPREEDSHASLPEALHRFQLVQSGPHSFGPKNLQMVHLALENRPTSSWVLCWSCCSNAPPASSCTCQRTFASSELRCPWPLLYEAQKPLQTFPVSQEQVHWSLFQLPREFRSDSYISRKADHTSLGSSSGSIPVN